MYMRGALLARTSYVPSSMVRLARKTYYYYLRCGMSVAHTAIEDRRAWLDLRSKLIDRPNYYELRDRR